HESPGRCEDRGALRTRARGAARGCRDGGNHVSGCGRLHRIASTAVSGHVTVSPFSSTHCAPFAGSPLTCPPPSTTSPCQTNSYRTIAKEWLTTPCHPSARSTASTASQSMARLILLSPPFSV